MTQAEKPHSVQPGDILVEKYRVERVLGQGGMGVVVLAEHIDLRERVAIKFLIDTPADNTELSERFLREARAAVRIKSEHVVRVSDVGRLPSGAPYMVMEFLEGEDLSQRLLRGPLPIEDAVDYVIQCCEAMHVAHRSGIVHRDLKPANLFLTERPDGSPLIKVLDFGISKVKSQDAAQLSLTHTQAMMGSPLYMSPEQMRSSRDVAPSADIWSLGVILHELISGDVPFTGSTFPEVLVQVMSEPPARLRALRPEVPEGLEQVVLRCLEKDPAERYGSVAALGVALSPFATVRTLGLQARLKSSVGDVPAAAPRDPARTVQHAAPAVLPGAAAPAALAQLEPAVAAREPSSRTNTAWAEQASTGARAGGARRQRLALAGVALAVLLGASLFAGLRGPSAAPVAAPAPVPSAPAISAAAAPSAEPRATSVTPAAPTPGAAPEPRIAPAADVPPAPEAAAPASPPAAVAGAPAAPDHTPASAPTATATGAASAATSARATTRRNTGSVRAEKTARAQVGARAQAPPRAPEPHKPAAPAAKPSASARSKPLSIEFK